MSCTDIIINSDLNSAVI